MGWVGARYVVIHHDFGGPPVWSAVIVLGYLFISLYIHAPIKIRRQQTKPILSEYTPIELSELPVDVSNAFLSAARTLAPCGFQAIGHLRHHVVRTGQEGIVSMWLNRAAGDSVQIIGVRTPSPIAGIRVVTVVTFRTEFSDGTSLTTTNTPTVSAFPLDPRVSSIRCPEISDLALLYRFHQSRVDRDANGRVPTLERFTHPAARLQLEHTETFERLIKAGHYAMDQAGQNYVPTWKGAYLMTYRLLPPFKQIRRMMRDAAANRTLKELGYGGLVEFRYRQSKA